MDTNHLMLTIAGEGLEVLEDLEVQFFWPILYEATRESETSF